jgi:ACR3 family arsenite efflux pump ArsB
VFIAVGAFWLSFTALADLARSSGIAATQAWAWPLIVDGIIVVGTVAVVARGETVAHIEIEPFIEAFVIIIVIPLIAAAIVQAIARRHRAGRATEHVMAGAMVPLMMLTLAVVIGSQIAAVGDQALTLLRVIPLYIAFLVIMPLVGIAAGRLARLGVPETRAVIFSGATRNSLVVLPLALALPAELAIAPLAVVTQTLIELVGMVIFVRLVPKIAPATRTEDAIR